MKMSFRAGQSVIRSETLVQHVRLHSELQIPALSDEFTIYKELKRTLQASYRGSPWFRVDFHGLGTKRWIFDANCHKARDKGM